MRRFVRYLALALLAWLPPQAVALPGLMTACELDPAHSPMHGAAHDDGAAGHAGQHAHGDPDPGHGDDAANDHDGHSGHASGSHGCCHLSTTTASTVAVAFPDAARGTLAAGPLSRSDFFPEQLQRPPLAAL
jgi:hypothetical protein